MGERALVLSADPWEMPDERTGEIRRGVSVWYVNAYREGDSGLKPTKVSADMKLLPSLRACLPAICEVEFGSRPGAGNKAQLSLVNLKVISPFEISDFLDA